jgi:hypothetical protein
VGEGARLLALSRAVTAAQLERTVGGVSARREDEARDPQERAHLSVFRQGDDSPEIHGRLAPEDGALVLQALDAMRASLWKGG